MWLQVNRARLLIGRGRFEEAAVLLRRARGTDARLGGTDFRTGLIAAEAELAAWSGQLEVALERGEEGLALLAGSGAPDPSLAWLAALVLRSIADAGVLAGRPKATVSDSVLQARARAIAAQIETAGGAASAIPWFASNERAQALLALLGGEADRVAGRSDPARWHEVGERWAALGRPFSVGYARLREAEAILASRGPRAQAAAALADGAAIAARLGAAPLAGLIATLARQARISLPTPAAAPGDTAASEAAAAAPHGAATANPYDLTAREAEVLRLVSAGWTNQQIADALVITRKTASVHVSNIMGKLGAANRGEAAALANRLGIVTDAPLPVGHG